jgi:hypothetical protein
MQPVRVEWVIGHARWIMLTGAVVWGLSLSLAAPGAMTGFMLVALGASGATFGAWRREPGLWMLAGLFLMIWLPVCVGLQVDKALHGLPAGGFPAGEVADFATSLVVMGWHVGFLATVFRHNRNLSRSLRQKE